jgi:hypothetical protein
MRSSAGLDNKAGGPRDGLGAAGWPAATCGAGNRRARR